MHRYVRRLAALLILIASLPAVAAAGNSPSAVAAVEPAHAGAALRQQAQRYRALQQQWQSLSGSPLQPGDKDPRVTELRLLLALLGDYRGLPGPLSGRGSQNPARFDGAVQAAVEHYQRRHGLTASGTLDRVTLAELAVPPGERARQLELNAERWDKLPNVTGQRYVLINVPDFRLQLVEQGRVTLSMKTVVGKTSTHTPTLRTRITNIVFNPSWTVPRSILLTELLPKARSNPEAMQRRGYRVVNYHSGATAPISADGIDRAAHGRATLRQMGGPGNTLGRVKFVMPNKQAIYLHDTQAQSLFELRDRAYSHGCIRLQHPEELAYALLRPQGWDRTRVAEATTGDESLNIRVDQPPRVLITYITAWVDNRGQVQFRRDLYHRDSSPSR
ncbi:L,D-transpeptidase family protein [Microbulbifer sp. SAOS-129_SWC]|uniref:L,D-transpeptidase family protein n=1 Tax=Microbulbifer sp. SAOS-129_SWC TaxID=3145235 RepID=UPI003216F8A9